MFCIWMTGLSGSGKSTIAQALQKRIDCYILDGDDLRNGLNSDLGFSFADRQENLRRTARVARILADAGVLPIVACISPIQTSRDFARSLFPNEFIEVYVTTPLEVCEARDPKGLYKRSRMGNILNFTGIGSIFEPPEHPEVTIHWGDPVELAVDKIIAEHYLLMLRDKWLKSE